MNKKVLAGLVAGAVVLAGGMAVAANDNRETERARQFVSWRLDDALDEIDANDAQRAEAQKLANGLIDEGFKLKGTKDTVRAGLVEQFKAQKADPNTVHALVDKMVDDVRGFAHKAADAAISFQQTMTPEQKSEVLERMEKSRSRSGRW